MFVLFDMTLIDPATGGLKQLCLQRVQTQAAMKHKKLLTAIGYFVTHAHALFEEIMESTSKGS